MRGRLAKEKATTKIDAIVALAIACGAPIEDKPEAFDPSKIEASVQLNVSLSRVTPWGTIQFSDNFHDKDC